MERNKIIVLLDNGHGVNTPGKHSCKLSDGSYLYEWKYAREIVNGIYDRLIAEGYGCVKIHPEDKEFISQAYDLRLRTDRANKEEASARQVGKKTVFISVHVNAAGDCKEWTNASGWQVHIANNASGNSRKLAQILYAEAEARDLEGNRSVPKEHYWKNDFWVVRKTNMPAVLTENLFMDNKSDVAFLMSEEGRAAIIDLHVQGIKKYIEQL